ncbi:MAG: phage holin family protein [Parcubacteria group bacterium]|jgi:putative membrane protein
MEMFVAWLVSALVIFVLASFLPGITVANFLTALAVALVMGLVNAVIKPVLIILTLPVNILTLGLFTLVINAFLVILVAAIVPGFQVTSFWSALIFSVILSLAMSLVSKKD